MFMPSARTWQEMKYEPAGFWPVPINRGDEFAFLLKAPTNVIKSAYRSAPTTLSVAMAATHGGNVLATVLAVADDPSAPLGVSGIARHTEEHTALRSVLKQGETLFVFFDELSRPVVRAKCFLDHSAAHAALTLMESVHPLYTGAWTALLAEVLDEVDAIVDPTRSAIARHRPELVRIPLQLTDFETNKITSIGEREALEFRLDDPDEGYGLEQTTWHLLVDLFKEDIVHSPQVPDGQGFRELTDILCFSDLGMCLIEAKAIAVLTTDPNRHTDRRARNVQKQIDKGVNQIPGALRKLKAGAPLSEQSGRPISIPGEIGPHRIGVIMVSELLPSIDWCAVASQLIEAAVAADAPLVVLDLQELRMLVGISTSPEHFLTHVARRFDIMVENRSAYIRTKLDGPPLP